MNKYEFLEKLQEKLRDLPERDVGERINFYCEMIDDRMEEGLSEEEAIAAVGTVEEVAYQITEEIYLAAQPKPKKARRKLRAWEIVLLILGSPLWLSLLIAGFAVMFSLYAVLWSVNLVLWTVELPFLLCAWISKGLLFGCKNLTQGSWFFTKKGCFFVKDFFVGKEKNYENEEI